MDPRTARPVAALIAAAVAAALPGVAAAHAFLDHAEPKVGSTLAAAPTKVTAHFTQTLEPAFSTMKVLDADGKQVDKADAKVDPNDAKSLAVSVGHLPAGTYKVEWKVTSTDTHKTHGSFTFTVQPKG